MLRISRQFTRNTADQMSKHVSRLLLTASPFRQYLPHQSFRGLRDQQVCFQHSKPKPELPLPEAGDGKKSTARGKLAVGALLIGCTAGFAWYVKNEKEMGKSHWTSGIHMPYRIYSDIPQFRPLQTSCGSVGGLCAKRPSAASGI